jgi:hypothetical protein
MHWQDQGALAASLQQCLQWYSESGSRLAEPAYVFVQDWQFF